MTKLVYAHTHALPKYPVRTQTYMCVTEEMLLKIIKRRLAALRL